MISNEEYEKIMADIISLFEACGLSDDKVSLELSMTIHDENGELSSFMEYIADSCGVDPVECCTEIFIRLTMAAKPVARENIRTDWMEQRFREALQK